MAIHQTMSGQYAQRRIDKAVSEYSEKIANEHWTIEHAHLVLLNMDTFKLDLFQVAGLAKAIACFQCSAE